MLHMIWLPTYENTNTMGYTWDTFKRGINAQDSTPSKNKEVWVSII